MQKMYTIKECSSLVEGITEHRIRILIKSGMLPVFRAGRKMLLSADDLLKAIEESKERIKNNERQD